MFPKGIVHGFCLIFEIFHLFILDKTGQNNTFHDILKGKNVSLDHGFGQTLKIFHLSILSKTGENNTFHDILEGKNVYLDNKNKKLKKFKN